uniref:Uncharacterized protein n=1 Tax=viral metagenome TaxID=1070528 RepID=A0A6C0DR30_9ZZZZ
MSHTYFYLINHNCKEFCFFENSYSIFLILETAMKINNHWKATDDIRVEMEGTCSSAFLQTLINDKNYHENVPIHLESSNTQ